MTPPLKPTKPPAIVLLPVAVTLPGTNEPERGPAPPPSVPCAPIRPPKALLPPPLTSPPAQEFVTVPEVAATRPPATLMSPTVTLPVAKELLIVTVVLAPVPWEQPSQASNGLLVP